MTNKAWKVFIVTSGKIIPEFYMNDPMFNDKHWTFVNVGKKSISNDKYQIINTYDIPKWKHLGKDWAESEIIFNIEHLITYLNTKYDYIGLIHWDFNLFAKDFNTYRITESIERILQMQQYDWISFFPGIFSNITGYYDVMMDERKPNCLFCRESGLNNPKSAIDYIFLNYDKLLNNDSCLFQSLNINKNIINPNYPISLCCSFLGKTNSVWYDLKTIIQNLYNDNVFQNFDVEHRHRFPGQFIERLIAVYSLFKKSFSFKLDHKFIGGFELNKNDPNGENY